MNISDEGDTQGEEDDDEDDMRGVRNT